MFRNDGSDQGLESAVTLHKLLKTFIFFIFS